jgi:hypothetical protein
MRCKNFSAKGETPFEKLIEGFFKGGAMGVEMGNSLFDKNLILKRDFESLYSGFEKLSFKVRSFRSSIKIEINICNNSH